jgi:hypothetical protein
MSHAHPHRCQHQLAGVGWEGQTLLLEAFHIDVFQLVEHLHSDMYIIYTYQYVKLQLVAHLDSEGDDCIGTTYEDAFPHTDDGEGVVCVAW